MISADIQNFLNSLAMFGWKLGLDRMWAILDGLGNPQNQLKAIHIAGTNGKGSVARILAQVYFQAGYKVGLYTSPHLVSPVERIRINGKSISESQFERHLQEIKPVLQSHDATYFEALTILAFQVFAHEKIDIAIIETGLGGRLDATNVIMPLCSVITSISLEHQKYLGNSLADIAKEKAGIVKESVPSVIASVADEALQVILQRCQEKHAPYFRAPEISCARMISAGVNGMTISLQLPGQDLLKLATPLVGMHQLQNIVTASAASYILQEKLPISMDDLCQALKSVVIPGRFQVMKQNPEIVLDVAHNPESMDALVETLIQIFPQRQFFVILGILHDKDVEGILGPWRKLNPHFCCLTPDCDRGLNAGVLWKRAREMGFSAEKVSHLEQAVERARDESGYDSVIIVTGSHYTVGSFLQFRKSANR